jgi:hypothetical protein
VPELRPKAAAAALLKLLIALPIPKFPVPFENIPI